MTDVFYHPRFASQYKALAASADNSEELMELFGEVTALLLALEDFGHDIEGEQPDDASHPIVISKYQTFSLSPSIRPLRYAELPRPGSPPTPTPNRCCVSLTSGLTGPAANNSP